jgi:hypothetical protein
MLNELVKVGRRNLRIYVEHALNEPQPVEVVPPPLLLPQSTAKVEIDDYELKESHVPELDETEMQY